MLLRWFRDHFTVHPWVAEALAHRQAGDEQLFDLVHWCPQCEHEYHCPDRYTENTCSPTVEMRRMGGADARIFSCMACLANHKGRNLAAWRAAHWL